MQDSRFLALAVPLCSFIIMVDTCSNLLYKASFKQYFCQVIRLVCLQCILYSGVNTEDPFLMLFSFLNVNPSTELRIRMKKSRIARMKNRRFRAIKEERMRVYVNSISMEESIKEMVLSMIDSASSFAECKRRVKAKRAI